MRIIDLALKDLNQLARDGKSALFLLIMPVAFTLLLGFVFSGGGDSDDPRLPVGFLDQDGGVLGAHLLAILDAAAAIRPVVLEDTTVEEVRQQVEDEELAAAVILPAGYSAQILPRSNDPVPRPILVLDPASSAGQTIQKAMQAALARLLGAVEATRLTAQAFEAQGRVADRAFLEETLARAVEAWGGPSLTVTTIASGALEEEGEQAPAETNPYAHPSAGIMVQFAMAGLMGAAEIIVLERKSGALRRLLTTPTARLEIILGHYLAMFVMILIQLVILVLFGQIVLGVDYLRLPLGTLLMVVVTTLWSASLGLLIGIAAKTDEQVIIFALLVMLVLAGLGGAWMSLEFTSETFQAIGHLTPTAWAIDGLENIVLRGLGLESIWLPAIILLAYTALFFAIGVWRFRFE